MLSLGHILKGGNSIILTIFFLFLFTPVRHLFSIEMPQQWETIRVSFQFANIMLLFLIVKHFKTRKQSIKLTLTDILFIIYVGVLFLLNVNNTSVQNQTLLITLVDFYMIIKNFQQRFLPVLGIVIVISGLTQILFGIINQTEFFSPGKNLSDIHGIFTNTGLWGGFVSLIVVILTIIFFNNGYNKRHIASWLLVGLIFFFLIFLVASDSRAAWISTITVFFIIGFRKIKLKNHFRFLIVFVLTSILLYGLYNYKKNSANGRLLIWEVSVDMIKENPI